MRTLIIFFSLMVTSGVFAEDTIPRDKEIIDFDDLSIGAVRFHHKMHAMLKGVECRTCHHTTKQPGDQEDCHNCHDPVAQAGLPKSSVAFHIRCRGCHQYTVEQGKKAGPEKKCMLCHVRASED